MQKYSIDIKGIHCTGCINLIKLIFEDDLSFTEVVVDSERNQATFKTQDKVEDVTKELNTIFKKDLVEYKYFNLTQI
ncbi:MAG: hypothetical protein ABIM99_01470 [Candidatus Dojkabacteria bacterium]